MKSIKNKEQTNLLRIPEQSWVNYREFCKKYQYFLYANIVFVSCTKASYDKYGNSYR